MEDNCTTIVSNYPRNSVYQNLLKSVYFTALYKMSDGGFYEKYPINAHSVWHKRQRRFSCEMRLKMTDGWWLINGALTGVMILCTNACTKHWRVPAERISLVCTWSTQIWGTENCWRTITASSVRSNIDELFWVISLIWAHVVSSYLKSPIILGMYPCGKSHWSFWVPPRKFLETRDA